MSKASQRIISEADLRKKRYAHGKKAAIEDKYSRAYGLGGYVGSYYPRCMAWRKGFLSNGGKKFW